MKKIYKVLALLLACCCTFSSCITANSGNSASSSTSSEFSSSSESSSSEDSSSLVDSSSSDDSSEDSSSSEGDGGGDVVQEPQPLAKPIDITDILQNEDGSTKLMKGNLGGVVILRGVGYGSFGSGWSHVEGSDTDTVQITNATYAFQSGFTGENYYLEGVFDSTTPSYVAGYEEKTSTGWAGLLLAHGATQKLSGAGAYKVSATIYESNVLLQVTNTWDNGGYATIFANWTQMFTQEELAAIDLTAVKLGALRYGDNQYAFYVNDRYVGSRTIQAPMSTSNTTEMLAESGIGVMGEQANGTDTDEVIRNFKYTADRGVIDALATLVPEKTVDLYLIAGQSNAAGNSVYKETDMRAMSESTYYGNSAVYYNGTPGATRLTLARVGQGEGKNKIGAEVGIAERLQTVTYGEGVNEKNLYDVTLGNYAAVVKRAVGGTSLLDDCTSDFDQRVGNWCPPSYAKELGKEYDDSSTSATGKLYRELVDVTVDTVNEFYEMGFTKVRVRGFFWMQGERNRSSNHTAYKKAFTYLVSDLRADLSAKLAQKTGQDFKNLAVFVGEVSETFDSAEASVVSLNRAFIALQRDMVLSCNENPDIGNVYIVETAGFALNKIVNGVNVACGADLGNGNFDDYHWNQYDMYDIGMLVGTNMAKITGAQRERGV